MGPISGMDGGEKGAVIDVVDSLCVKASPSMKPEELEKIKSVIDRYILKEIGYQVLENRILETIGFNGPAKLIKAIVDADDIPLEPDQIRETMNGRQSKLRLWSIIEDTRLLAGILKFGLKNWANVASFIGGGRTRSESAQRWFRCLNPRIVKRKWSEEEDEALRHAVIKFGVRSWTKVSKDVGTRCDTQCRYRYTQMEKALNERKAKQQICGPALRDSDECKNSIAEASEFKVNEEIFKVADKQNEDQLFHICPLDEM